MAYEWNESLAFSRGEQEQADVTMILRLLPGCVSVEKTDTQADKAGTDYIATLRGGRPVNIDAKLRSQGCSRYWKGGEPELALEKWSVMPDGTKQGKIGWTLSESSTAEMVLFRFHPDDCPNALLLSFQNLRMAFIAKGPAWFIQYKTLVATTYDARTGNSWRSECVFVPKSKVWDAIQEVASAPLFSQASFHSCQSCSLLDCHYLHASKSVLSGRA
jgi:hypothetical protein